MSAVEYWKNKVQCHHEQSTRAQGESWSSEDFWRPFASAFRADPRRTDDPTVNRLARQVDLNSTILDVGGGAGRLALPVALHCRHVTVVEPSESMLGELREGARESGIKNISIVQGTWEEVDVEPADVVFCAHVVYGVADIEPFVRKLDARARERVLIPIFMDSPQAGLSPFWKAVHGEERVELPALPELLRVLWEMEIYPDLEMPETGGAQAFESREAATKQLRQRLYVKPGTEQDKRLETAMRELLEETPDGLAIRDARPRRLGLLSWRPG